ncbi:hypothetical protein FGO68_gene11328 [Halteria grandinella]|uniref:Response regulatory domain-containing protein n=1 Tax=Halteria grandinella TaxID=5974 RepID=A0A8J8P5J0_HALGN|nr:hypothetical protein FGO68_gene11328 [Halteria grandinella]
MKEKLKDIGSPSNRPPIRARSATANGIQRQKTYDIILLDLHMPVLDGFQTATKLREMHNNRVLDLSDTKIVALSAITENQFLTNESQAKLFDGFMEKPVNFMLLKQYIQQTVSQIRLRYEQK